MCKNSKILYHATYPSKLRQYYGSKKIIKPVRGFTTLLAAVTWGLHHKRAIILRVEGSDCHKLPDHHNEHGEAWWIDHDIFDWEAT